MRVESEFLYRDVLHRMRGRIEAGLLRPGDRLPSLRELSRQLSVSVPTVRQAYLELEREERIEARPKSGYYVRSVPRLGRLTRQPVRRPSRVQGASLVEEVHEVIHRPGVVPLGIANPTMAHPATKAMHRALRRIMGRVEDRLYSYAPSEGEENLRRQIALRYLADGLELSPDDLIITNGAQEALSLALHAVAKPGDVVAVESPCYYGHLEIIEALGLLALEVETCPTEGVVVGALERALDEHPVRACLFSPALNNPLGCQMPTDDHQRMVELLEERGIPLIEDDVYRELGFGGRSGLGHRYTRAGNVISCSSFSKTAAPGHRLGWVLPGRFRNEVHRRKRAFSSTSALLPQLTMAEFLSSGDYDRHLQRLIPLLSCNAERMAAVVSRSFPTCSCPSRPVGGSVVWVEVPGVDGTQLFREAAEAGVSLVPGAVFGTDSHFSSFIRLSFGFPWCDELEAAVERIGALAHRQL